MPAPPAEGLGGAARRGVWGGPPAPSGPLLPTWGPGRRQGAREARKGGGPFGHQSGLYGSSGRLPTTFLYGITFCVYLVFSEIGKNTKQKDTRRHKMQFPQKNYRYEEKYAVSPFSRNQRLGTPIHIKV